MLGYARWEDYVRGEFNMGRAHSYRLLDQGRVIREIESAAGGGDVSHVRHEITHREVQDLKPILGEVTDAIRERVT